MLRCVIWPSKGRGSLPTEAKLRGCNPACCLLDTDRLAIGLSIFGVGGEEEPSAVHRFPLRYSCRTR